MKPIGFADSRLRKTDVPIRAEAAAARAVLIGTAAVFIGTAIVVAFVGEVCCAGPPAVKPTNRARIEEAARTIDQYVESALDRQGSSTDSIVGDEQFVRRFYLDASGRIPTLREMQDFLESTEPDKRSRLIREVLRSRGHVSHQYNFWADILRIKDEDKAVSRAFYINWLKDSLASNKPYDEFVRELVTASGGGWKRGNGAVGYYLRDRGMPLDNMANTLRIFAGTQLACAQCHDHPNDRWTRRQFFEMAAYTADIETAPEDELYFAIYAREQKSNDEDLRMFSHFIRNTYHYGKVVGASDGKIELPADYQYDDARAGEVVEAHPIFGSLEVSHSAATGDYRQCFADWLTSRDNPRFTRVIANRLWKRVMGRGLVEPVDDFRDDSEASHPELLDYLTQLMKDLDYDMRAYCEVLYNTKTYQRPADPIELADGARPSFRRRQLTRMTAEQVWDSLMTLIVPNIDEQESGFFNATIYYHGYPVLIGKEDMHSWYEATEANGVDQHWRFLAEQFTLMKQDLESQANHKKYSEKDIGRGFYRRLSSDGFLVRASELRAPAEPSHFLRTFGQSSRESIEGANTASNVTQFLSMFNGLIEARLLQDPDSLLMTQLSDGETFAEKCDIAFQCILTRRPTEEERDLIAAMPDKDANCRLRNVIWALVNSQEFIFVK